MPKSRLQLISAIIDVATSEQSRPLKEFFKQPRLPIREMYLTRVIINLVFFARNYLNIVLLFISACAFFYPVVLSVLLSAALVHFTKQRNLSPTIKRCAKVFQLAMCLLSLHMVGLWTVLGINILPMIVVGCHAAFTPYTDEAMGHYEKVMTQRGFSAPAPRSPTQGYANVDKTFADARLLEQSNSHATSLTTPGAVTGSEASALKVRSLQSPRVVTTNGTAINAGKVALAAARTPRSPTTSTARYQTAAACNSTQVSPKTKLLNIRNHDIEGVPPAQRTAACEGSGGHAGWNAPSSLPLNVTMLRRDGAR